MKMAIAAGMMLLAIPLLTLGAQPQMNTAAAPLDGFDAYVDKSMRDWDVPGMALAIVRDDLALYGVRHEQCAPRSTTSRASTLRTCVPLGNSTSG